jgi:hypothetical protein
MKSLKRLPSYILIWVITLMAIATLIIVASPRVRNAEKQEAKQITEVPKVISKVKDLEVISTAIERQGEPGAVVAIEIRNNSDKPIIAIAIESGDEKDAAGVSTDGFKSGDEPPAVILQPHGTITMKIALSNLLPGKPLKISGVMYADGTEDGEELTRKTLRGHRDKAKAKGPTKKGGSQP